MEALCWKCQIASQTPDKVWDVTGRPAQVFYITIKLTVGGLQINMFAHDINKSFLKRDFSTLLSSVR